MWVMVQHIGTIQYAAVWGRCVPNGHLIAMHKIRLMQFRLWLMDAIKTALVCNELWLYQYNSVFVNISVTVAA